MPVKKVAIACQGGGTHAAFTWGVLTQLLENQGGDAQPDDWTFQVTGFSGTSAGALCALAAWYGLVPNEADPECGSPAKAVERLDYLWNTFAAETPVEQAHDRFIQAALELKKRRVPMPPPDPYSPAIDLALRSLSMLGARDQYLSFNALLDSLCPHFDQIDWPAAAQTKLRVLAGAIEVPSGNFEVFDSHKNLEDRGLRAPGEGQERYQGTRWRMRRPFSLEGVAASGTLPEVLPAQRIPETEFPTCVPGETTTRDALYWDGLYSHNPPVHLLLDEPEVDDKPDEIWIIRINPQELHDELSSLEDIKDRENDLAGNLSLNAQLDNILTLNKWIHDYGAEHPPLSGRKVVTVRTIKMRRETAWRLHVSTKLDRSRRHLETLHAEGREVAAEWLDGWRTRKEAFEAYPNDARYPCD